jgi:hypothetical protein
MNRRLLSASVLLIALVNLPATAQTNPVPAQGTSLPATSSLIN